MRKRKRIAIALELEWVLKHHQDVFAGTQAYARRCGDWDCILSPYPERLIEGTRGAPPFDGILARVTRPMAAAARAARIPLVNVWYSSPVADDVLTVAPDFTEIGRMAARHLLARGLRRFVFVGVLRTERAPQNMLTGYAEVIRKARLPLKAIPVRDRFAGTTAAWEVFQQAMERWIPAQALPVGIFCDRDLLARYVVNTLARHGVKVPHEAAVVGQGNEELVCTHPEPSLTSIEVGHYRVGFHAAELLDRMIEGKKIPPRTIYLPPRTLIPRRSTDALVVEDGLVAAALRFIADRSHDAIRVRDVAAAVHISRRTLERRFRAALDQSVARHIALQRVERAKRLLVERRDLGKQVARDCGFPSTEQMWLTFKRFTGLSPTAFRKQSVSLRDARGSDGPGVCEPPRL
jgi:LacI family transcriptional regulator